MLLKFKNLRKKESKIGSDTMATVVTDSMLMTRCAVTERVSIILAHKGVSLVQKRKKMAYGNIN